MAYSICFLLLFDLGFKQEFQIKDDDISTYRL